MVRERSAKPLCVGSIPTRASNPKTLINGKCYLKAGEGRRLSRDELNGLSVFMQISEEASKHRKPIGKPVGYIAGEPMGFYGPHVRQCSFCRSSAFGVISPASSQTAFPALSRLSMKSSPLSETAKKET